MSDVDLLLVCINPKEGQLILNFSVYLLVSSEYIWIGSFFKNYQQLFKGLWVSIQEEDTILCFHVLPS